MKAVICGAGIAGLALAQPLAHHGWSVTVVEQAAAPRQQGYMIDFFGLGYDAAEQMGLLPRLKQLAYEVRELAYVDDTGRRRAGTDYDRFSSAVAGRMLSIMRPDLEQALHESLSSEVKLRYGCSIGKIANLPGGVSLTLTDGELLNADLLVGADGIHSKVRSLVFGPEEHFMRYLGLHTTAYTFSDPAIHAALQDRLCLTDTVDKMMGFYGLRDGDVAAFAVHRSADPALPHDIVTTLRETYASLGWLAPAALAQCPPAHEIYYDQVAQVEVPHWHRGRVALVGDACQAVSLIAGQGASLAMAGAYALAEHLSTAASVPEALSGHQRLWQPVVMAKQRSGRTGAEWFLPSSRVRLQLRRTILRLSAVPALNRVATTAFIGKTRVSLEDLSLNAPESTTMRQRQVRSSSTSASRSGPGTAVTYRMRRTSSGDPASGDH